MVLVLTCQTHSLPREKVCGQLCCSLLLCDQCFREHSSSTNHLMAVCLNSDSLNYFCTFTQYLSVKMKEWSKLITNSEFTALFCLSKIEGSALESKKCLLHIALQTLHNYGNLMQSNNYFVNINKDSATLYHPEFLKDLYNMVTQSWEVNSRLMTEQIMERIRSQKIVSNDMENWEVSFQRELMNQIQKYRNELIAPKKEKIIFLVDNERKVQELMEVNTNDKSEQSRKEENIQGEFISQFQLSQVSLEIQTVDSYETIQEIVEPALDKMKLLKEQNNSLRIERDSLIQDNIILRNKCEQLQATRQGSSSLKKQRSSATLNNQLLGELVELQAEIVDKDYDLHILVEFLNDLVSNKKINRAIFEKKLLMLRTVRIQ